MTFDYSAWGEQLARVARVLVHNLYGDWFTTFEPRARIEIGALAARVQFSFTG